MLKMRRMVEKHFLGKVININTTWLKLKSLHYVPRVYLCVLMHFVRKEERKASLSLQII